MSGTRQRQAGDPKGWNLLRRRGSLLGSVALQVPSGMAQAVRQENTDAVGVNFMTFPPRRHQSADSVARAVMGGLEAVGYPHSRFSSPHDGLTGLRTDPPIAYTSTVAHVQPGNLPLAAARTPRLFRRSNFVACVTYWETLHVKGVHRAGIPVFDEIWTISDFCREAFSRFTKKPVRAFPYPVVVPSGQPGRWRQHMGLDDQFVFSFQFDMASTTHRKDPQAVVEAYRRAFPEVRDDTVLVIKTMNTSWFPQQYDGLAKACAPRPDVRLVTEFWPDDVNDAYYEDIDCYVSLHRAEGLGIGMARSMSAGKPVIATGYSGNLDFMTDDNSVLVPFRMVLIGENPVYRATDTWALPDIDYAADAMRTIRDDEALRGRLGRRAASDLAPRTLASLGSWFEQTLPAL